VRYSNDESLILLTGGIVMIKDYYKAMEISPEATREEIKQAYRKLAMQYHPDRNRNDPTCEAHLKEVNEAYDVLGNEQRRRQYDFLHQQNREKHVIYEEGLRDDLDVLWAFFRGGIDTQRMRGCQRRGFGKRGCRRRGEREPYDR
jgi:curved DNA-binding protein CbpA